MLKPKNERKGNVRMPFRGNKVVFLFTGCIFTGSYYMASLLFGSFSNLAYIEQPKFQSPKPTDLEGMKEVYELVDYPIGWDTHISVV